MRRLEAELDFFTHQLFSFAEEKELKIDGFGVPDHLAYKCHDGKHYDYELQLAGPYSDQISEVVKNERRLAAAKLSSRIIIPSIGTVEWLEIMEPRPEKAGADFMGLEHLEFFNKDFNGVSATLDAQGVDYQLQANDKHAWISIIIDEKGREIKLTNRRLSSIVALGVHKGEARVIKKSP